MGVVLLDTSVASLLHPKKKDDPLKSFYAEHMQGQTLALCFQAIAELWDWAENNNWGERSRKSLDDFIRRFLVIPYDYELTRVWARLMTGSRKAGRFFEAGDCWIAATAIHYDIPLLAHDKHFLARDNLGLKLISCL